MLPAIIFEIGCCNKVVRLDQDIVFTVHAQNAVLQWSYWKTSNYTKGSL